MWSRLWLDVGLQVNVTPAFKSYVFTAQFYFLTMLQSVKIKVSFWEKTRCIAYEKNSYCLGQWWIIKIYYIIIIII